MRLELQYTKSRNSIPVARDVDKLAISRVAVVLYKQGARFARPLLIVYLPSIVYMHHQLKVYYLLT